MEIIFYARESNKKKKWFTQITLGIKLLLNKDYDTNNDSSAAHRNSEHIPKNTTSNQGG